MNESDQAASPWWRGRFFFGKPSLKTVEEPLDFKGKA